MCTRFTVYYEWWCIHCRGPTAVPALRSFFFGWKCARCGWALMWWWIVEKDSSMVWAALVDGRKLCVGLCCKHCDAHQSCHLHEDIFKEVLVSCMKGYLLLLQLSAWCFCWVRSINNNSGDGNNNTINNNNNNNDSDNDNGGDDDDGNSSTNDVFQQMLSLYGKSWLARLACFGQHHCHTI